MKQLKLIKKGWTTNVTVTIILILILILVAFSMFYSQAGVFKDLLGF